MVTLGLGCKVIALLIHLALRSPISEPYFSTFLYYFLPLSYCPPLPSFAVAPLLVNCNPPCLCHRQVCTIPSSGLFDSYLHFCLLNLSFSVEQNPNRLRHLKPYPYTQHSYRPVSTNLASLFSTAFLLPAFFVTM